uniref:Uncharacterized protein n=1 Tax=Ixodes ricinus TaxID=34613 RepID=A0A6B0V210_IXORI
MRRRSRCSSTLTVSFRGICWAFFIREPPGESSPRTDKAADAGSIERPEGIHWANCLRRAWADAWLSQGVPLLPGVGPRWCLSPCPSRTVAPPVELVTPSRSSRRALSHSRAFLAAGSAAQLGAPSRPHARSTIMEWWLKRRIIDWLAVAPAAPCQLGDSRPLDVLTSWKEEMSTRGSPKPAARASLISWSSLRAQSENRSRVAVCSRSRWK